MQLLGFFISGMGSHLACKGGVGVCALMETPKFRTSHSNIAKKLLRSQWLFRRISGTYRKSVKKAHSILTEEDADFFSKKSLKIKVEQPFQWHQQLQRQKFCTLVLLKLGSRETRLMRNGKA